MHDHPTLDELVQQIAELRPLGAVATRVIALAASERFSAHELATTIASDQALSAKLLRLANSAYYGYPRRVATVRDAVVLLGFRQVRQAALATSLVDALPGSHALDYGAFWQHSLAVGVTAELLARAEGAAQDEAFTAGVLHNIGRLAMDQHLPEAFASALELARAQGLALRDAERIVLGYTDAQLGGALVRAWQFPSSLAEAVERHELRPEALPERRSLTGCVVRARLFVRAQGVPDGLGQSEPGTPDAEWSEPPLSVALGRQGGVEGLLGRVDAFIESAVGG
jgi:HD-like signal output (HDOD) protein